MLLRKEKIGRLRYISSTNATKLQDLASYRDSGARTLTDLENGEVCSPRNKETVQKIFLAQNENFESHLKSDMQALIISFEPLDGR